MSIRSDLEAAWAEWMAPIGADGKRSQGEAWRKGNPAQWLLLKAYREGTGSRPSLPSNTGRQMVFETDAWLATAPAPPGPSPTFGALLPARLAPSKGDGGTIVIAPTGNDTTGTGSLANPYRTPRKAFNSVALSGGLILARGGLYDLSGTGDGVNNTWSRMGDISNPPQIKAYPGESPVFTGTRIHVHNNSGPAGGLRFGPGIRITRAGLYDGIKTERIAGHIEFIGLEVDNCAQNGLLVGYNDSLGWPVGPNVQIWDSIFHHNGNVASQMYHGVYFGAADATCLIANCLFYDNAGFAGQWGPHNDDLLVTCCTNYGNAGPTVGGFATWSQSPHTNNNAKTVGVICSTVTYAYAYSFSGTVNNPLHADCVAHNSPGTVEPKAGWTVTNVVTGDPMFRNVSARDLHIGPGSSAIGLVQPSRYGYVPPLDMDGLPRITADAGCYRA